jgi:phosphatidylserine/phosphatidylglycerophosphate/cardiolipin synthase-like enzyme
VDLIVQPEDGLAPVLQAIKSAKEKIDLTIFRLDRPEVIKALIAAVSRGVAVRAMIAAKNGTSEKALRKLELKLLAGGVVVARSAEDLTRYHGKLLILDAATLYLLGYNYTKVDLKSRSFGLIIEDATVVREALRLFEADVLKKDYTPSHESLVVSPVNSRKKLSEFIAGAKQELLIYDGRLSDRGMIRLLEERARAGVDVRILGHVAKSTTGKLVWEKLTKMRLHIRAIVRDGAEAFVGSQSLRKLELDGRREVGMMIAHRPTVKRVHDIFEQDWAATGRKSPDEELEKQTAAAIT